MSSSSDTPKHRHTLPRKCKKFYSTPILRGARSPSSISASAIDTTSSSGKKRKLIQTDHGKERRGRKNFQEGRSSEMLKKEKLKEKSMSKKRKLSKKLEGKRLNRKKGTITNEKERKKRKQREKTILVEARESEYNWETCDNSSGQSPEVKNLLLEDIPSPEHIRDAPRNTDLLHSPTFLPRQFQTAKADSPRRIIADEKVGTLHVKDLAFCFGFSDSDEEEEDELILNRQSNVRAYPPQKNKRAKKKKNVGIDKSKAWLVDVAIPTASSDLLWNDYVEKNHEKVSKYIARPGNDKRRNSNIEENSINNAKGDFLGLAENWSKETNLHLSRYRKKMNVARGYYDKSSRTFVNDVSDLYDFPGREDKELVKDVGTRMTLHQFRQKRGVEKRNVGLDLSSSSSTCQSDVEKMFRTSRHLRHNEKVVMNIPRGNVKSASKKLKTTMADVSRLELQRINDIRKFASRLKAKKEAMISNDTSLCSTSKNDKPSCTVTSLERTYKNDVVDKQVKNKRLRSTKRKSVPNIKSIETLRTVRFERNKQNWRII